MTVELWHAILNPSGPNYERLKEIFGEGRVPLQSSQSIKAQLGEEKDVPVYMLDLKALPLGARSRLIVMVAKKCDASIAEVEHVMNTQGFPIREADVIVSFDMRAFV